MLEALDRVAERFPVEDWRADGLGAWPLFRYEICTTNFYMFAHRAQRAEPPPVALGATRLAQLRDAVRARRSVPRVDGKDAPLWRRRDALFFSDGVSFTKLGGHYVEKFCDPLLQRLEQELQLTGVLVTPLNRALAPRQTPSVLVQPQLELALLAGAASARARQPNVHLPGFDDATALLARIAPGLVVPSAVKLFRNAHISRVTSRLCEAWLRLVRPRVVFLVAFYGNERAAMLLACRRLGIPTVDLQHGAISAVHFAYARLGRLPPGGYELLPDWFWVWSERERDVIEPWAGKNGAHRVVVGGNPFITYCQARQGRGLAEAGQALDDALRAHAGRAQVLYSASGYETEEQLRVLADVIGQTAKTHRWWLRMHPSRPEAAPRFVAALQGLPAERALLDLATKLPLPVLLSGMQAHVTEGSSTAEEAALFGVPTVLFAEEGVTQFAPLLERRQAVGVSSLADVPQGLAAAAALALPRQDSSPARERAALEQLFAGSRRPQC